MSTTRGLTRRRVLLLASGAGAQSWFRLYAGKSDFWNKKDPSQWSSDDIGKLAHQSPWAKEVNAATPQYVDPAHRDLGPPDSGGGMNPGGMGGGGAGGTIPGMRPSGPSRELGRRGPDPGMPMSFTGTVRWESAKPVQEALKTPLKDFAGDYVISITGIPILGRGSLETDDGQVETAVSRAPTAEALERIQNLSYLQPKGKDSAQPALVKHGHGVGGANMLLFGFPREFMPLTLDDKEVSFSTTLGRLELRTKFSLKDMMYHGELAL